MPPRPSASTVAKTPNAAADDRFAAIIANSGRSCTAASHSRLEQVDQPDRRPVPDHRPGAPVVRRSDPVGDVTQSSSAFGRVANSLSFFRAVYDAFAGYRAAIIRLDGLLNVNETARALASLTTPPRADRAAQLD